jgi:hypothetical protein
MKILTGHKNTVSVVLQDWGKQTIQYVLDRIERFIISSNLVYLKNLSLLIKCDPGISVGAISEWFNEKLMENKVLSRWLIMGMNASGGV